MWYSNAHKASWYQQSFCICGKRSLSYTAWITFLHWVRYSDLFAAKGKIKALKVLMSNTKALHAFTELGQSWELKLKTSSSVWKKWPAPFIHLKPQSEMSMSLDIIFSVPRMAKSSRISYHHVKMAFASMQWEQTTKRMFGGAVCKGILQYLIQLDIVGRWQITQKTNYL